MALPATVRRAFETALSPENVITDRVQCRAYECDGLTGYRVVPELVLLPRDAAQVAAAVRVCAEHRVPFVARGAGTGLSGGALPVADGVVISLARLKRVLEVDPVDRRATVEPGVTNLEITAAAAPHGLYYAPDPSSQQVCTIGGNVAENSGGAHCLKYGFTTNHVLEIEVVLADGSVVTLGSDTGEQAGPDLRGVFLGSEGTLGITTKIVVRLLRTPESVRTLLADFPSVRAAGDVVSDIVGAGIVPAAVEMMDTLAIEAAEEAVHAGYTVGVPAALVVELDGPEAECDAGFAQVKQICERHGCTRLHVAGSPEERAAIWRGRKAAFAAVGRISPDYFVQDGVVPRTRLAEVLGRIARDGRRGRAAGGERLPRGRREPAPAGALQRRRRGDRPGRAPVGGDRRAVRRAGRVAVGRARDRHGQGVLDAEDVRRGRPGDDGPGAGGVRPARAVQPGQGAAHAAAVRGAPGSLPAAPARGGGRGRAAVRRCPDPAPGPRQRRRHRRGATVTATLMNPTDLRGVRDAVLDSAGTLAVAGAGTAAGWAGTLGPVDAVLDLRALTGVITHNPGDMTVSVRAGTPLRELNAELAGHGQHVALDAARVEDGATVGGLLSTGDAGPGALVHGSLRDLVIGATLVLADGTVARTGGHVIKNVAGYDLAKLVHGAYGTLAVIAEVVLRLHPLPHATATLVLPCPLQEAAEHAALVLGGRTSPRRWSGCPPGRACSCGSRARRPRCRSG